MKVVNKTVQVTDKDLNNLAKELLLSKYNLRNHLVILVFIIFTIQSVIEVWVDIGNIILLVFLLVVFFYGPIKYVINYKLKRRDPICKDITYNIDEECIEYNDFLFDKYIKIKWNQVYAINMLKNYIIIFDKNDQLILVPKQRFEKEELELIIEIIREKVKHKKILNNE